MLLIMLELLNSGLPNFANSIPLQGSTDDGDVRLSCVCGKGQRSKHSYSANTPEESARLLRNTDPTYQELERITEALLEDDENVTRSSLNRRSVTLSPAQRLLNQGAIYHRVLSTNKIKIGNQSPQSIYRIEFKRNLTASEKQSLQDYINYSNAIASGRKADDVFLPRLSKN